MMSFWDIERKIMEKVYADNSSTSFPKAPGVSDAVKAFLDEGAYNAGRGGYGATYDVEMEVLAARKLLAHLFGAPARNVIFTPGVTYSLNMVLRGFLQPGDHVVTTSMEHNGVMRCLHDLAQSGVKYDVAPCDSDGGLDVAILEKLINPATKAVVVNHASNVCGTILPIYDIADICRARGVRLIVDAAQTAGLLPLDAARIDAIAFTAHKGLLAMPGLGGFVVSSDFASQIRPIISGGTGSMSADIAQPGFLPDKFESGTLNIPAIIGLKRALEYIETIGVDAIHRKEMCLADAFISGIRDIRGIKIIGKQGTEDCIAVVSLDFVGRDNAEIAAKLDADHGIMTRCGLHCAPGAHRTLGTYPHGTVRFSFGHFNTQEEIAWILSKLRHL